MGQLIAFPLQPVPYRDVAADLSIADSILLAAIRTWVAARRENQDPIPRLRQALDAIGLHDAAFSVDAVMAVVACAARWPVEIHCPPCPNLSRDEQRLLHAASLAQAGDTPTAETVLRKTLLSAEGAAFITGPLDGLGSLLAQARLLLSRRPPPDDAAKSDDPVESWSPSPSLFD